MTKLSNYAHVCVNVQGESIKMARKAVAKKAAATNTKTKAAAKKRREWSKQDLQTLNAFAVARRKDKAKAPWKGQQGIVTKLNRTEGAIRQKAFAEGISLS